MKINLTLFALLFYLTTWSQNDENSNFPPANPAIEIKVSRTNNEIIIDGNMNEQSWMTAAAVKNFFRREPRQGGPVKNRTEVRFLYDAKNLYILAICKDSLGLKGIRIQDLRRDFYTGENDMFGIALDPQNLKQYAQGFQTTPYGNQRDFQNFNGLSSDVGWNALWKVRTQRSNKGYVVEMAIPFKSLRYNLPKRGNTVDWGITLIRHARKDVEISTFPAIPQSLSPYRMTYAAKLTGIEVPPPSTNTLINPYTLYQYDAQKEGSSISRKNSEQKVGLDAKWAINPRTVIDLTINTDFAQADVDRAVNNLERFNVLFPERRQFFLENSGIWAGAQQRSIRPFFSRQIGLQCAFNALPAPIDLGLRFTQRTVNNTLAGLYVRQRETENSAAANFGVVRYQKNYGKENNIGVMLTHRLDQSNEALHLNQNTNMTVTLDGQIRPDAVWDIQYLLSSSHDELTNKNGFAGRFFIGHRTNKHWIRWSTEYIGVNYQPRIGFVKQNNLIQHDAKGYYIWRPKKINWIRRWDPGIYINYNHDAGKPGNFQQASIYIFPVYVWFKDNSFMEFSITPTWQNINFTFRPLGIEINEANYRYTRYKFEYYTNRSKKLSGLVSYNFGDFYNGSSNILIAGMRYAPSPKIAFNVDYENNTLRNLGASKQDLSTDLYSVRMRMALNPRVQFSSFYQYNSFNRQGRLNLRFSWEYSPLSFVYLVFNDAQTDNLNPVQQNTQFISKITFLKQF